MNHHCQCATAGHCPLFRRVMNNREHHICRGYDNNGSTSIDPERRDVHINHWTQQAAESVGLGDQFAAITKSVGVAPCESCQGRQTVLNQTFPKQHWLTRLAGTFTRAARIKQPEPLTLPSLSFEPWQISTTDVTPSKLATTDATPFPVVNWDETPPSIANGSSAVMPSSFVWVYWKNGAESDEIQYSIRSVQRFVPGAEIVICGDRPSGFDGTVINSPRVTRRDVRSRYGYTPSQRFIKWVDSIAKLESIIASPYVRDNFLWMYDDTFLAAPTTFEELAVPRFGHASVSVNNASKQRNTWREVRRRTFAALASAGLPTRDYSTHFPTAYNKRQLAQTIKKFEPWKNPRLIESLYLNHHAGTAARYIGGDLTYVKSAATLSRLNRRDHYVINVGHGVWHQARETVAGIIEAGVASHAN